MKRTGPVFRLLVVADLAADAGNAGDTVGVAGEPIEISTTFDVDAALAALAGSPRRAEHEAAWHGVRFLAEATAACSAVRLEVLAAAKADFLDVFFARVFRAEHAGEAEVPLSAVALGYEFDRSAEDVELLRHAGRMGESLRVPFLAAVGPAFWGIKQPRLLPNLPDLVRKVGGPEYARWNGLRKEEAALWLCLASGRFRLRDGHPGGEGEAGQPLWGSAVYALAAALAHGFAAEGIRFPATGPVLRGLGADALEAPLSDTKADEIVRVGLAPLVVYPREEALGFLAVPMLQMPRRYDRDEATRSAAAVATLPYQAFSGAAAQALQRAAGEVRPGSSAEEVQQVFEARLRELLGTGEDVGATAEPEGDPPAEPEVQVPQVQVETQPDPESPEDWEVAVRLRPRFLISGAEVDLVLGSRVPR